MNNIKIKKAELKDWPIVQKIALKTFSDTYRHLNKKEHFDDYIEKSFSDKQVKAELKNPNSEFYFFYLNEELIGYLKLNKLIAQTEMLDDSCLEIERLYLSKKHQGHGIGKSIIDYAIKIAKEKNKSKIWLGVWSENLAAIRFYKKMGFFISDTHIFKMGEDEQMDYVMEMDIIN